MTELKFEIEDAVDQVVDLKEQEWQAVEEDRKVFEAEILVYKAVGILDENHLESKDLEGVLFQRSLLFGIHTVVTVKAGYLSVVVESRAGCSACSGIGCPLRVKFLVK
jgi:hypothetical protein